MDNAKTLSNGLLSMKIIGMKLIMESCSTNEKADCEVIGMRCRKYLILRILKDNYSDEFHIKETSITVTSNTTYPGCVISFPSRIIQHISSPDKLFFVEYRQAVEPKPLEENPDQRHGNRIRCFVPVHLLSGETVIKALVDNISIEGCHCFVIDDFLNNSFKMYSLVSIQFSSKLSIEGEVRFIKRKFLQHHLGISFTDIDDDTKRKLMELIPSLRF